MNLYLRNLIEYTQEFGLFSAVLLIIQRKLHCKTIRINPKGIKHWIECRNGTSDFAVLRQVIGKKDSLLKIGGWNERFDCCQDNEVCLRAIQAGLKFSFCPDPGAVYRIWSENTVCRKNPQRVISTKTQLIDAMFEWLKATAKLQASHVAAAGRMSVEMARMLAKDSIAEAGIYAKQRKSKGSWNVAGPAAPWIFRVFLMALGYTMAERFAKAMRNYDK